MFSVDIVILGGGIAGLWSLTKLHSCGYPAILLEQNTLGAVQTLASQAMIHGGQKYTLSGRLSKHATNIASMPDIWDKCLNGAGEIDLTDVKILSNSQIMWAANNLTAKAGIFAASKTVRAATEKIGKNDLPEALKIAANYDGAAYLLPEKVLDIKSLIKSFYNLNQKNIYKANITKIKNNANFVEITTSDNIKIKTKMLIATAGAGNEDILSMLGIAEKKTQRRPLKQIMIKSLPFSLYGHCIEAKPKPKFTVTSHPLEGGEYVWYFGGAVAENTVNMNNIDAIKYAKSEILEIFPKVNWENKEWAIFDIDRAEPYNRKGYLPQSPHIEKYGRVVIGWPVKLTFAPAFAEDILKIVKTADIDKNEGIIPVEKLPLDSVDIGNYPWEVVEWQKC